MKGISEKNDGHNQIGADDVAEKPDGEGQRPG